MIINKTTQVRSRPTRVCVAGAGSYCEILFSDSEGSDLDEDEFVNNEEGAEDESYDASTESLPAFDQIKETLIGWTDDESKVTESTVIFVTQCVEWTMIKKSKGYRLFLVHYFDDPDDGKAMWPEELVK